MFKLLFELEPENTDKHISRFCDEPKNYNNPICECNKEYDKICTIPLNKYLNKQEEYTKKKRRT
jgi:hypothetical protein